MSNKLDRLPLCLLLAVTVTFWKKTTYKVRVLGYMSSQNKERKKKVKHLPAAYLKILILL